MPADYKPIETPSHLTPAVHPSERETNNVFITQKTATVQTPSSPICIRSGTSISWGHLLRTNANMFKASA